MYCASINPIHSLGLSYFLARVVLVESVHRSVFGWAGHRSEIFFTAARLKVTANEKQVKLEIVQSLSLRYGRIDVV